MMQLGPRVLEILGCKCIKQSNYEADDVMATLGVWCHSKGKLVDRELAIISRF